MGRIHTSDDIDHDINPQETSSPRKKPRRAPPKPWQLSKYQPMHIQPLDNWHTVSNLPRHVNPARPYDVFNLFLTDVRLLHSTPISMQHYTAKSHSSRPPGHGLIVHQRSFLRTSRPIYTWAYTQSLILLNTRTRTCWVNMPREV